MLFFYHGLSYVSPETLLALGDKAKGAVGLDTPFTGRTTRVERSECGQDRLVRQPEGVQLCVGQLEAHPDGPVCIDRALWPR